MIKFIYSDVGGVLLDWSKVFEDASVKFNLSIDDIYKVFNEFLDPITKGSLSAQEFWEKCIQKYSIKNADNFDILKSWVSDYQPIRAMHEFIYKNTSKYKIGLLSNIYKGMLPLLLKKRVIPDIHYDQIVFSCDVGMMKPYPDIYAFAQEKATVDAKEILLVDDREDFLVEANKAGWNTFLFDTTHRENTVRQLEKYLDNFLK